jgi:hypothetical protein
MPQNRQSGAEADRYGRECARKIATALGATQIKIRSNECVFKGERVVIHCAQRRTKSVGVTLRMLEGLDAVLGAFEQDDGTYQVWRLSAEDYAHHMIPTRSRGSSSGKVGIVKRVVFERNGVRIATVRLSPQT